MTLWLIRRSVDVYRIDFSHGYLVYFSKDGNRLVLLVARGTKKRQGEDIAAAKDLWRDYKRRKRLEETQWH